MITSTQFSVYFNQAQQATAYNQYTLMVILHHTLDNLNLFLEVPEFYEDPAPDTSDLEEAYDEYLEDLYLNDEDDVYDYQLSAMQIIKSLTW